MTAIHTHAASQGPADVSPTVEDSPIEALPIEALPLAMKRELRSDHAGELGAVWIYRGILAVSRDAQVRAFAEEHMAAEQRHLDFFVENLPTSCRTRLGALWGLSGFLLGAAPALFGRRAVYATVAAVETFVDDHYQVQLDMLEAHPGHGWLRERLGAFRDDELHHRDEARKLGGDAPVQGLWAGIVIGGSRVGAELARRF